MFLKALRWAAAAEVVGASGGAACAVCADADDDNEFVVAMAAAACDALLVKRGVMGEVIGDDAEETPVSPGCTSTPPTAP